MWIAIDHVDEPWIVNLTHVRTISVDSSGEGIRLQYDDDRDDASIIPIPHTKSDYMKLIIHILSHVPLDAPGIGSMRKVLEQADSEYKKPLLYRP